MRDPRTKTCSRRLPEAARASRAFTLMEMMVVIGLVALLASLALPSIVTLYNAGADAQAYNLIAAQLTGARALAIEKGTFAGVHGQLADAVPGPKDKIVPGQTLLRPELEDVCFTAMVLYDEDNKHFNIFSIPQEVPGSIAYGKLTSGVGASHEGATMSGNAYASDAENKEKFTTFTVVFTGLGSAVKTVNGAPVHFNPNHKIFLDEQVDPTDYTGSKRLWKLDNSYSQDQYAVTALTLFDLGAYIAAQDRKAFLNTNAQFLPLNVHTGQLFARE